MAEKLESVNEQLDELLLKQLSLIQDYINVTVECESHQKSGFLNLAKARYIQGFHSVSRNCLYSDDTEEERIPILTVTREKKTVDVDLEKEKVVNGPINYEEPNLNVNPDSSLETKLNNQFGMLSSNSLRTAKADFRKCLEKSMERVKIIEQSVAIRERYKMLMKEKREIQLETVEVAAP